MSCCKRKIHNRSWFYDFMQIQYTWGLRSLLGKPLPSNQIKEFTQKGLENSFSLKWCHDSLLGFFIEIILSFCRERNKMENKQSALGVFGLVAAHDTWDLQTRMAGADSQLHPDTPLFAPGHHGQDSHWQDGADGGIYLGAYASGPEGQEGSARIYHIWYVHIQCIYSIHVFLLLVQSTFDDAQSVVGSILLHRVHLRYPAIVTQHLEVNRHRVTHAYNCLYT